ncbi:hypothetical protein LZ31DRAFT_15557 [Colletotrichum somersetense]|nr:hypothetical protein LZ31DRAFT_15557 [Colletotrichum somersetense]
MSTFNLALPVGLYMGTHCAACHTLCLLKQVEPRPQSSPFCSSQERLLSFNSFLARFFLPFFPFPFFLSLLVHSFPLALSTYDTRDSISIFFVCYTSEAAGQLLVSPRSQSPFLLQMSGCQ